MTLKRKIARGAATTALAQVARLGLQLISIILLARLLTPEDYGVLALAMVFVGLGELLREFGLSSATVQAKEVSDDQQSNLFWLNVGVGASLALISFVGAGYASRVFEQPALQGVLSWLSLTFLVNGMAAQHRARLNRKMEFGPIAAADFIGQLLGTATGIGMAMTGWGVWSLVGQQIAQALSILLILNVATRWMPSRPRREASIRSFLSYGWGLMGAQLVNYASRNVDSLLIGHQFGGAALGVYNRAYQLLMMPLTQLSAPSTTIALPVLAQERDEKRYKEKVLAAQTFFLNAIMLMVGGAACTAAALIPLLLGKQWTSAIPLFEVLCVAGFAQAAGYASYWVFLSKGLTTLHFKFTLMIRPFMIGLIFLGSTVSVLGVAAAYAASVTLVWLSGLYVLRHSGAPVMSMLKNGLTTMFAYGGAAAISMATHSMNLVPTDGWYAVLTRAAIYVLVIALMFLAIPPYRKILLELYETVATAISKKKD